MGLPVVTNSKKEDQTIEFSDKAIEVMKSAMSEENNSNIAGVRIAVMGGGCSGFMYDMHLEDNVSKDDKVFDLDGLKVYIDNISLPLLKGVKVDYRQSFKESGFVFENPSATNTCGCGTSFTV